MTRRGRHRHADHPPRRANSSPGRNQPHTGPRVLDIDHCAWPSAERLSLRNFMTRSVAATSVSRAALSQPSTPATTFSQSVLTWSSESYRYQLARRWRPPSVRRDPLPRRGTTVGWPESSTVRFRSGTGAQLRAAWGVRYCSCVARTRTSSCLPARAACFVSSREVVCLAAGLATSQKRSAR